MTIFLLKYTVTHPDYDFSTDSELDDNERFFVSTAEFTGKADLPKGSSLDESIGNILNSGLKLALFATFVSDPDESGDSDGPIGRITNNVTPSDSQKWKR